MDHQSKKNQYLGCLAETVKGSTVVEIEQPFFKAWA
jgi:hypothetical protein